MSLILSTAEYCCILISVNFSIDLSSFFHSTKLLLSVVQVPALSLTTSDVNATSSTLGVIYPYFNCISEQ